SRPLFHPFYLFHHFYLLPKHRLPLERKGDSSSHHAGYRSSLPSLLSLLSAFPNTVCRQKERATAQATTPAPARSSIPSISLCLSPYNFTSVFCFFPLYRYFCCLFSKQKFSGI